MSKKNISVGGGAFVVTALFASLAMTCWRAASSAEPAVITLNPRVTYQTMSGWEATAQAGQEDSPVFSRYRDALYDQAVNDLGINRVRLEIRAGAENPRDWWAEYRAGQVTGEQFDQVRYTSENDNADPHSIDPKGFKFARLDSDVENVVLPLKRRLEARGEKLFINLCYVDFGASSFEHKADPEEYAEFVLATYQHTRSKYGLVPDAWEVILEPDNSSAGWTATQVADAMLAAGRRLSANGFTPAFVVPATTNAANAPIYFDHISKSAGAMQYVSEIAYHRYCCASTAVLRRVSDRAVQFGKRSAMLELIGADYHALHEDLKAGRASSWQQYTLAYPTTDNGAQYYTVNDATATFTMGSRTRFLRQYFRHVRMNAVRIEAAGGNANFDPLAFINTNGRHVVVVRAALRGTVTIQGLPEGTYGIEYTTPSRHDVAAADARVAAGQPLNAGIPESGVITVYAK